MKFALSLLIFLSQSDSIWTATGTSRLLTKMTPSPIVVAPGVYAEPNLALGQAAYNACMALPNSSVLVCIETLSAAVVKDANDRFLAAFLKLYQMPNLTQEERDAILAAGKLWLTETTNLIVLPPSVSFSSPGQTTSKTIR